MANCRLAQSSSNMAERLRKPLRSNCARAPIKQAIYVINFENPARYVPIFACYKVVSNTEDFLGALELQKQKKIMVFKTVPLYISAWLN